MNELFEKAKRDYPIGTKAKSIFKGLEFIVDKEVFIHYNSIFTITDNCTYRCIYDKSFNKWAEIIKEDTMTQQEFNSLEVGDFIGNYEILHKYKEFLIVRCEDGHDLFDLAKINKFCLKVQPKTFMGLEVKKYDYVPCEINGEVLVYLVEVQDNHIFYKPSKHSNPQHISITSIRIL
jgi:hypothetical protein